MAKKESFIEKMLPKSVQNVLWIVLFFGMVGLLFSAVERKREADTNKLNIKINQLESGNHLISEQDVEQYLKEYFGFNLQGLNVEELAVDLVEDALLDYPYIKQAQAYVSAKNQLHVNIAQREPLLRIIDKANEHYYISKDGEQIPVSRHFTARVPVANGVIPKFEIGFLTMDKHVLKDLYELANYMSKDQFLNPMIEQIYVDKKSEFVLVPKLGREKIELGSMKGYKEKLKNLEIFYKEGLRTIGWNKYKSISLKIDNQVVCEKINTKENQ